jgi:hypothetical protein
MDERRSRERRASRRRILWNEDGWMGRIVLAAIVLNVCDDFGGKGLKL